MNFSASKNKIFLNNLNNNKKRIANIDGEQFIVFEAELQNIHPSQFEGGSVENALSQLESVYLGLKNIFLQARKAFVQQKTGLFEIRLLADNIDMIKEGTIQGKHSSNPL